MFYKFIINEHAVLSRKPTNKGRKDEDLGLLHEGVREAVRYVPCPERAHRNLKIYIFILCIRVSYETYTEIRQ